MGQLPLTTTPVTLHPSRRQSESPTLWIALFAGSIVLHGCIALGLRSWADKTLNLSPPAPISVEFVSLPAASDAETRSARPLTTKTAAETTVPDSEPQPDPNTVTATPEQSQNRQTAASRVRSRSQNPNAQPSSDTQKSRDRRSDNADNARRSENSDEGEGSASQSDSGNLGNSGDSTNAAGGEGGNPPNNPTQPGGLPMVPITSERGSGQGISLSVAEVRNANRGRDVPDTPVQPTASSKDFFASPTRIFADAIYLPEVGLNLRTKITVEILIDRDGKPQTVNVLQGSRSEAYDEKAKELLQELLQGTSFVPAQQNGQPVDALLEVDVVLNPL